MVKQITVNKWPFSILSVFIRSSYKLQLMQFVTYSLKHKIFCIAFDTAFDSIPASRELDARYCREGVWSYIIIVYRYGCDFSI